MADYSELVVELQQYFPAATRSYCWSIIIGPALRALTEAPIAFLKANPIAYYLYQMAKTDSRYDEVHDGEEILDFFEDAYLEAKDPGRAEAIVASLLWPEGKITVGNLDVACHAFPRAVIEFTKQQTDPEVLCAILFEAKHQFPFDPVAKWLMENKRLELTSTKRLAEDWVKIGRRLETKRLRSWERSMLQQQYSLYSKLLARWTRKRKLEINTEQ